jgi:hypothetical protein
MRARPTVLRSSFFLVILAAACGGGQSSEEVVGGSSNLFGRDGTSGDRYSTSGDRYSTSGDGYGPSGANDRYRSSGSGNKDAKEDRSFEGEVYQKMTCFIDADCPPDLRCIPSEGVCDQ